MVIGELARPGTGGILPANRSVPRESPPLSRVHTVLFALMGALCVAVLAWAGAARAASLDIDYVDGASYVSANTIVLYVDVLDDDYNVIPGLDGDTMRVFIDNKEVKGRIEIETVATAKEWVAVAILMSAHQSYAPLPKIGDAAEDEAAPTALKYERDGFSNFVRKFEKTNNKVAVYLVDEKGHRTIDDWSEEHAKTAERIADNAKRSPEASRGDVIAPRLYKALKAVVDDKIGNADNLPRRRIVLLLSDGKDKYLSRPKKIDKSSKAILAAARTHGVKIYAVGFTLDATEPLVHLRTLATKSGGIYREIKPSHMDDIPRVLENIAVELQKQYVVRFMPDDDFDGAEKPVKVSLKVVTDSGRTLEDEYNERVKIGEKAFDWRALLFWLGVVVGALLGLWILRKIFRAIAARRGQAPVYEEAEAHGPYRGKLLVTTGPHAGLEFYLTEDVITIGSVAGNGIVIEDAGISKRHAGIKVEDMRFELSDFGSTNGTRVNGVKITKQFLRDGDEIAFGDTDLRFSLK